MADDPAFVGNKNFRLDAFNVVIGVIAQCCLTMLPMYLIVRMNTQLLITTGILTVCILILKRTWWDRLNDSTWEEPVLEKPTSVLSH